MLLEEDLRAYEAKQSELEQQHSGKFVVFHSGRLVGVFDDFDAAGNAALLKFGNSPSLIRKIGESAQTHVSISLIRSP